jgi:tetratricopeptide (TPR) repeat protein
VGQVVNFLAHFGASSAKIIILLRTGQLGKVLQITKSGRTSPDENLSLYWLLTLREAMLRAIAFDFEGARQICQAAYNVRGGEFPDAQYYSIDQIAAGKIALQQGKYSEAVEHFRHVQNLDEHTKFFMHWEWRMMVQVELSNTWLLSGNIVNARTAADGFLKSALSTSDPHLQALGWELQARVAIAESDLQSARESIQQALAIVDKSEILVAAWQVYATAWQLYRHVKEHKTAETNRERAETCILKIANSFAPDEPLRTTFMSAAPVRLILHEKLMNTTARKHGLGRVAAP